MQINWSCLNTTRVFAGGADNACGAIGAGILSEGKTFASIGTSGVVLSYEASGDKDFQGKVHYFNHGAPEAYYTMGVTLAAGYSLTWFKDVFAKNESFDDLLKEVGCVPVGSNGLLFTPYIDGESTPHADAQIRASFIGMDRSHEEKILFALFLKGLHFLSMNRLKFSDKMGKKSIRLSPLAAVLRMKHWFKCRPIFLMPELSNFKVSKVQVWEQLC